MQEYIALLAVLYMPEVGFPYGSLESLFIIIRHFESYTVSSSLNGNGSQLGHKHGCKQSKTKA